MFFKSTESILKESRSGFHIWIDDTRKTHHVDLGEPIGGLAVPAPTPRPMPPVRGFWSLWQRCGGSGVNYCLQFDGRCCFRLNMGDIPLSWFTRG